MFTKPVDTEEVPDYNMIIQQPMDLETMMTKIDMHSYLCARDFLDDIDRSASFMKSFISLGFLRKLVPTGRETMRNIFYDCVSVGGRLIVSFKIALHAAFELARTKTASS